MDPYDKDAVSHGFQSKTYPLNPGVIDSSSYANDESDQYFNISVECKNWCISNQEISGFNSSEQDFLNNPKQQFEQQINMILSHLNVRSEAREFVAESIRSCARRMVNVTHRDQKLMCMRVVLMSRIWMDLDSVMNFDFDDDDDDFVIISDYDNYVNEDGDAYYYEDYDFDDDDDDEGYKLVLASTSCIEELEMVKVEEEERVLDDCTICFEDFNVDSEALCMPCLHMFHRECIVNWLYKANTCPLCRFKIGIKK